MELVCTTSRPYNVHKPFTHRDTQLPLWYVACTHLRCALVQEGGSLSTLCVVGGGELDTMPPPKEHYELLAFFQKET